MKKAAGMIIVMALLTGCVSQRATSPVGLRVEASSEGLRTDAVVQVYLNGTRQEDVRFIGGQYNLRLYSAVPGTTACVTAQRLDGTQRVAVRGTLQTIGQSLPMQIGVADNEGSLKLHALPPSFAGPVVSCP